MAPSESKLKQSKALRQLHIDSLDEVLILAQSAVADESRHTRFKLRYASLETTYVEFQKLHFAIISMLSAMDQPNFEEEKQIRASFEDNYYTVKTIYNNLLPTLTKVEEDTENISKSTSLKLPKISLPTFDGSYRNWPNYYDLFSTLIHNNKTLSDIEKFQYLLSSVSAQALGLIKNIPISADNYAIAYQTLSDRYQNRRLLANSCWQEIVNAPKLTSDSPVGLRKLLGVFSENLAALKNLGLPTHQWGFVLYHLLIQKLEISTLKRYELKEASTDIPSYDLLQDFLVKQCTALETVAFSITGTHIKKPPVESAHKQRSSFFTQSTSSPKQNTCNYCRSNHSIYKCVSFSNKSPVERLQIVKDRQWCFNCLHSKHSVHSCSSQSTCRICQQKHHTLLHSSASECISENTPSTSKTSSSNIQSLSSTFSSHSMVLLSTVLIEICDASGTYHTVRAIIDGGSQTNVITQRCVQRLRLKPSRTSLSIFGLGQLSSRVSNCVSCTIRPRGQMSPTFEVDTVVLPKICADMPNSFVPIQDWQYISNLKLADPGFNVPSSVDMLLGAEIFSLILRDGRVQGGFNQPIAINTALGWILFGRIAGTASSTSSLFASLELSLDSTLRRFWEIEEVPRIATSSPEDMLCEKLFSSTHFRESSGRYSVGLPFKGPDPIFNDSKSMALRRFYSLERRLMRNKSLHESYCDVMRDYLESGHMEPVGTSSGNTDKIFYIPHHSVLNLNSSTTKLRVVFDASAKTVDGISLNDTLLVGPKLQKDIVTLLLHFRLHAVVVTADVKQMYRQINLHSKHRDYQRILFRFSQSDIVQEYRLTTVAFGVSSSPFLALRTLQQLALDEGKHFPLAADVIRSDTFVDDVVTGVSTVGEAVDLRSQLDSLLGRGKFSLRKWTSNSPDFLNTIPENLRQSNSLSFSDDDGSVVKILGLRWLPHLDIFSYSVVPLDRPCTKRAILSELAKTYDPLGFLSPITFFAKYLIQYLWTLGLDWDETPPSNILARWREYRSQLSSLSDLRIPRRIIHTDFISCQLHGFCDSSERGFSAVIYFRFQSTDDSINISLICAKSKVAPLARLSIPRLELCAALLLSKLISFVTNVYLHKVSFSDIYAWSDSSVALTWIRSPPHKYKTFVSNRISEIQNRVSPACWHHVSSADNPADCASRGLLPSELLKHSLWWSGPAWLKLAHDFWPECSFGSSNRMDNVSSTLIEEERKIVLSSFHVVEYFDYLLNKFSSLAKIERIICYCLRFLRNSRQGFNKSVGQFTADDLHAALLVLVKHVQYVCFSDIIEKVQVGQQIPKSFRKLGPFIGEDGVLRVGGRLTHSSLLYDQRHPALLPRHHRLTVLIIEEVHRKNCHPGLQTLQFLIQQNFWILSPRRAINHVLSKCLRCFRVNPKSFQPPMGNLPASRVNQVKPFQYVGVDFGGPFHITLSKSRGIKTQKAYLCLFVCFATKALHLELASDLTSECFLAALRRFIARRGRCTNLFSDRGTNFVGAKRELELLIKQASESENICWSFNPPSAPHFGGLWEAGIKSVKSHLMRVIGHQILTYEELYTVLVQIEATLNSRPLCPLSSDPHDLSVLTPGHFLTLEPLTSVPSPDLSYLPVNRLSRWQLLQRLHQDFWRRWHCEYLHTLQQRHKWIKNAQNVSPGMLVLIKEDNTPPLKWRLGRIEQVHPGKDEVCRVATVKSVQGSLQRPLVKLCPLPLYDQNL